LRTNTTKAKLQAGDAAYGLFVRYPDATLAEVLAYQGWDFLVFDGEHGTIEPRDCEHLVRAVELHDVTPVARVPTNQPATILRFLDTGAQGVQVPWVNTGAEAGAVVRAAKYGPLGARGLASVRAADFGQRGSLADYVEQANRETLVVVQVETVDAVDHLDEILAVPGIDVVFIGPNDLSHSLGFPGQPQHPTVQTVMQQIAGAVAQSPAALGIMVANLQAAREWRARGARYITINFESLVAPVMRGYLQAARTG
jgi:4-hydroxy-2-oxoheptanedioate aldolase